MTWKYYSALPIAALNAEFHIGKIPWKTFTIGTWLTMFLVRWTILIYYLLWLTIWNGWANTKVKVFNILGLTSFFCVLFKDCLRSWTTLLHLDAPLVTLGLNFQNLEHSWFNAVISCLQLTIISSVKSANFGWFWLCDLTQIVDLFLITKLISLVISCCCREYLTIHWRTKLLQNVCHCFPEQETY